MANEFELILFSAHFSCEIFTEAGKNLRQVSPSISPREGEGEKKTSGGESNEKRILNEKNERLNRNHEKYLYIDDNRPILERYIYFSHDRVNTKRACSFLERGNLG